MPPFARMLGLAGLLPLLAAAALLALAPAMGPSKGFVLAAAHSYAALILSFLGGLWWGLGAASARPAPRWLWVAAVLPSLIAWGPMLLVAAGALAAKAALAITGGAIILALPVDRALVAARLAPAWWLALRFPLSLGLGGLSLAVAGLG